MKSILLDLTEDLVPVFLHLVQLEDNHLQIILQTGVATASLPYIQTLLSTYRSI